MRFKIDLKRTTQQLLIAEEFHELGIVLCSSANEVHSFPSRRSILYFLTAIIEPTLIFLRPQILQFCHESLPINFRSIRHINKGRLIGRASKRAKDIEKVLFARRTRGDNPFRELQIRRQRINLHPTEQKSAILTPF